MALSDAKILENTRIRHVGGSVVQLQISDAPLDAEAGAIRLALSVPIPSYRMRLLAQVEREVIDAADTVLHSLLQKMATEIQASRHDLHPTVR